MPVSIPPQGSPLEEATERLSKAGPGLLMAARAVGLEDHRRMLHAHARRVDESNAIGAKVLGMADIVPSQPPEDEMGDIIITGDIYGDRALVPFATKPETDGTGEEVAAEQPPPAPVAPATPAPTVTSEPTKNGNGWLLPAVMGAAAIGVPVLGAVGYNLLPDRTDPPAAIEHDHTAPPDYSLTPGGVKLETFDVPNR